MVKIFLKKCEPFNFAWTHCSLKSWTEWGFVISAVLFKHNVNCASAKRNTNF